MYSGHLRDRNSRIDSILRTEAASPTRRMPVMKAIGYLVMMLHLVAWMQPGYAQASRYFVPFTGEPVMSELPSSYQEYLDEVLAKSYNRGISAPLSILVMMTQGANPMNIGNLRFEEPVSIWFEGKVVKANDGSAEFADPQSSIRALTMVLRQISEDHGLSSQTRNDSTMIRILFGAGGELESVADRARVYWEEWGEKWPIEQAVETASAIRVNDNGLPPRLDQPSEKVSPVEIPKGTVLVSIEDLTELKEQAGRVHPANTEPVEVPLNQSMVTEQKDTLITVIPPEERVSGRPAVQFMIGGEYGYLQRLVTQDVVERRDTFPMDQYGGHVGLRFNIFPRSPIGLMVQTRCGMGYRNVEGVAEGYYAQVTGDLGLKLWFLTVYGGVTRQYSSWNRASTLVKKQQSLTTTHVGLQINPFRKFGLWVQVSNPEHLYQQRRLDQGIYTIGASFFL